MKNKTIFGLLVVVLVAGLAFGAFAPVAVVSAASLEGRGGPNGNSSGTGTASRGGQGSVNSQGTGLGTGYGSGLGIDPALAPLSDAEITALQEAILEEYGALNLYQSVIAQFGSVYPFSTIARAEQQHINVLVRQADKYGVTVPVNPGLNPAPVFATLADACQAGVDAEIADAALYDTLKLVTTHTDLLRVYNNLQSASLNNHLPAFEACN